jgi:hypothetical protein
VEVLSAPVALEPLVASAPDQPPEAVQAVALVEDQVRVEAPPLETLLGLALKLNVGAGVETDTVTDCEAEPPAPEHVSVYLVAAVIAAVEAEPLVALLPLHPAEAAQAVALTEDHVSVEAPPVLTVVGFALSVTEGADGVTDTVVDWAALPPAP